MKADIILHELEMLDWECVNEDTRYLTHNYHPYSSKYIPQIPRYLVTHLLEKGGTVLDCFVGSGTTLVECKLLARNAIGIDMNPLGCLLTKVKTTPIQPSLLNERSQELLRRIESDILLLRGNPTLFPLVQVEDRLEQQGMRGISPVFLEHIRYWFQPHVIAELTAIKNHIDKVKDQDLRDFFTIAFSSILRTVSNAAPGFGNLMISNKPLARKQGFEKFRFKLVSMVSTMEDFYFKAEPNAQIQVRVADARNMNFLLSESMDMICTHPPYMASVPYAEYQKLSLWWLGFDPSELDAKLIGGQRSRSDTAERYIQNMQLAFSEMYRVLKIGKFCCVVIGNPLYRGKIWPLNKILADIGQETGFSFLKEIIRGKYKMTMGKMKNEYILIFKK